MEVQDHNLLANATFVLPGQSAENLIQTCETYISFVESSKMPSPSDFGLAGLPWPTYHSHARPQPDRSLRRSSDPHSPLCDSTPVGAPPHHPRVSSGVGVQPWPVVVSGWWLGAPWWLACQLPASSRPYTACAISLQETTLLVDCKFASDSRLEFPSPSNCHDFLKGQLPCLLPTPQVWISPVGEQSR